MQLVLILFLLLLLAVALFALQNPDVVAVQFWPWKFHASVAVVTLGAMTVGAALAGLVGLAARLTRWTRRRAEPAVHGPEVSLPPRPAGGPPIGPEPPR